MCNDTTTVDELMRAAASGDAEAVEVMIARYRGQLRRMVQTRLNPQLRGRVDASDVVQEAHLEITRRLERYLEDPHAPVFLWMRSIVSQKLIDVHRRHLGAEMRDADREIPLHGAGPPEADSGSLAVMLGGHHTTPSHAAVRAETHAQLHQILNSMKPADREVLTLRHFEQLSNIETAQLLGISESGATARYVRALRRLKERMSELQSSVP